MLYSLFNYIASYLFKNRFTDANFWNKNILNWYTKCRLWNIELWKYKNYISIGNHVYDYSTYFRCECVEVTFLWKTMTFVDGIKIKWNDISSIEKYLWKKWLQKYARYIWQDINTDNKKARNSNNQ